MAAKPKAFAEPSSPLCGFRNMDLALRILSVAICIAILIIGGVATSKSGVILIGILGPPVSSHCSKVSLYYAFQLTRT